MKCWWTFQFLSILISKANSFSFYEKKSNIDAYFKFQSLKIALQYTPTLHPKTIESTPAPRNHHGIMFTTSENQEANSTEVEQDTETVEEKVTEKAEEKSPTEKELLEKEIKELESILNGLELDTKRAKEKILESGKTGYLRIAASVDTYKRGRSEELKKITNQGMASAVASLCPIFDQLEDVYSTYNAESASEEVTKIYNSYNSLYKQMTSEFEKLGLSKFNAVVGEGFYPQRYTKEREDVYENTPPGIVMEALSPGYEMNGLLVRSAKCVVSAEPPSATPEETADLTESANDPEQQ